MALPPLPETIDHFRVVSQLGAGGMGVVYRAEDLLLHRPVALKVMRAEHVADPRRRERFVREARMAASLVHPNVATVYEVGEVGGTIFIAMELVPGGTLRTVLSGVTRDHVAVRRALRWSVGIARALARAHELGIVHRDLKPDNVMVLPDDEVKLLDFGIAKGLASDSEEGAPAAAKAESMTAEGVVLGTPAYMSPEQARGERLDVRSDVFSFGAMLFEMLSGVSPFLRATPLDTLAAIVRDAPPRLEEIAGNVPADVREIVARCLAKAPKDRFANGGELMAALQGVTVDASADEPAAAPPKASGAARAVSSQHTTRTEAIASAESRGEGRPAAPWVAAAGAVIVAAAFVNVALRSREKTHAPADASAVVAVGCTSNSACSREHDGGAWKCNSVRHECVEIASAECTTMADEVALGAEDTVWLGALYPTSGPDAKVFAGELRAVDLARRDFASALGSSVARHDDLHARPIAVVVCDESVDPVRSAKHLAEDVEVPAVIGFRWSKTAISTIPSVFLPDHVLSFIAISQATELTRLPQAPGEPRLIWRSTFSLDDAMRPVLAFVSDVLEPRARAAGLGARPLRVARVRTSVSARDNTDPVFRDLRFNGKSALENGDNFREYVFDDSADGIDATLVASLLDFAPHVVFVQGKSFVDRVVRPLEKDWRGSLRPTYVEPSDWGNGAFAFAGTDPERRKRFFGVTNASTTMPNAELVLHYNLAYPQEPIVRTVSPQPSYDAFYTLADAIAAIGDGPVTGQTLSRAFGRLRPPGLRVDVGPAGVFESFRTLRSGGNIDLEGAIGSLDFDDATGEAPIDYVILCFGIDDRGRALPNIESGLVYDARARVLKGTLHCP